MKIGLIRETKVPEDNRVALTPDEIAKLRRAYPGSEFAVQRSSIRAYADEQYARLGIPVVDRVDDCDILFGIKEAALDTLIPGKHYFFFGHVAKKQVYNRPLLRRMMELGITFSDYEYLVDNDNRRVCAFGWWAGAVGVYYTLRAYGMKTGRYDLPKPDRKFTLERLIEQLGICRSVPAKLILTGNGRVSCGAQHVLERIGAQRVSPQEFSQGVYDRLTYTVVDADLLVKPVNGDETFDFERFIADPRQYESAFMRYGCNADLLICCHYWSPGAPVYLSREDLRNPDLKIRVIGDITCDIDGSIRSTLRSSTHEHPFYDYNPATEREEPAFSSEDNITVMAVDTCPNALALDTSAYFGEKLTEHVFRPLLEGKLMTEPVIRRSTILENGRLTERFAYLQDFVND